jgi:hypothetical protein
VTPYEKLSLIIASIAAGIAIIAIIVSGLIAHKNNSIQKDLLYLNQGTVEYQIKNDIDNAEMRVEQLWTEYIVLFNKSKELLSGAELAQREGLDQAMLARREKVMSAYDVACQKYLDEGKVDKIRFKKALQNQLRQLVANKPSKAFLEPIDSKYHAIKEVYDLWENPERKRP